jgi:uncharacterized protein (DUF779 family)
MDEDSARAVYDEVPRVELTPAAAELLRRLRDPEGEFRTGGSDVLLAELDVPGVEEPVTFWMSRSQYAVWSHTRLIVDVVEGRGSGFSLEVPEGVRFLIRSRVVGA